MKHVTRQSTKKPEYKTVDSCNETEFVIEYDLKKQLWLNRPAYTVTRTPFHTTWTIFHAKCRLSNEVLAEPIS